MVTVRTKGYSELEKLKAQYRDNRTHGNHMDPLYAETQYKIAYKIYQQCRRLHREEKLKHARAATATWYDQYQYWYKIIGHWRALIGAEKETLKQEVG